MNSDTQHIKKVLRESSQDPFPTLRNAMATAETRVNDLNQEQPKNMQALKKCKKYLRKAMGVATREAIRLRTAEIIEGFSKMVEDNQGRAIHVVGVAPQQHRMHRIAAEIDSETPSSK
jgi:hypothetical protein